MGSDGLYYCKISQSAATAATTTTTTTTMRYTTVLAILIVSQCCGCCVKAESTAEGSSEASIEGVVEGGDDADSTELAVIAVFAFLFAACISLATVTVAYFASIEDALMRRFLNDGIKLQAKVIHSSFVRNTPDGAQYAVVSDYRYYADDDDDDESGYRYATVLRKQLKCLESDMYRPFTTGNSSTTSSRRVCIEVQNSTRLVSAAAASAGTELLHAFPSFDVAIFEEPPPQRFLQVLVLAGHPNSAISAFHVQRAVQLQRQWPTAVLISFLSVVTLFCVYLGLIHVLQLMSLSKNTKMISSSIDLVQQAGAVVGISLALTMVLFGVELMLLHTVCREMFLEAVYEDYLHGNGAVELKTDDETLNTLSTQGTASWKTPLSSPIRNTGGANSKHSSMGSLTI